MQGAKGRASQRLQPTVSKRAECSRAPCPLPWLDWEERGGGRLGARRDEEWAGEQRPGEDSRAPVRQVITRQVNKTVCMYVLEIESSSSPVE